MPTDSHARRPRSAREIEDALGSIVRSDEPTVVLSSLARASNPAFSDACAVELSAGTDALFQVSFPMPGGAAFPAGSGSRPACAGLPPVTARTVATAFRAGSGHGYPAFAGLVVHSWIDHDPTEDDVIIARLLVDRALAIVQAERLAQQAARADDRAAKLAIELITSRVEGEAIGILMARHQVASEEAVSMLRRMSWTSHRELHEAAADVVHTGERPRALGSCAGSPPRSHLRIAAADDRTAARTVPDPADQPRA
jgi:ANTAR domain